MTPDTIADRALPLALRAVRAARRRALALARKHPGADPWALVDRIRAELAKVEPQLARILTSATLAGWVLAARRPVKDAIPKAVTADVGGPANPDPPRFAPPAADEGGRPVVFPLVRAAVRDLMAREVVTQREYDDLGEQARAAAFTVARVATAGAVEAVRDAVAETVAQGKTLREFREDVAGALDGSGLSESQVETVFRTQVGQAQAAGLRAAYDHPAVAAELPYLWYDYTHDARARPDHVYLGTHGLDGTGVYRCDDPVIRRFLPPWSWNCFLPGSEVQGRFQIGMRFWYRGQAVEIATRHGHRLRVTANHPILTPEGFRPAKAIKKGDHVLRHCGGVEPRPNADRRGERVVGVPGSDQTGFTPPRQHEQQHPARAEDVFRAMADVGGVVQFPVRPDDFHGDAVGGNGDVDVVGSTRELLFHVQAAHSQFGGDLLLPAVDGGLPLVPGLGPLGADFRRVLTAAAGLPGGGTLLDDGGRNLPQGGPFQPLCVGLAARLCASRFKPLLQDVPGEPRPPADAQQRLAGQVVADELIEAGNLDTGAGLFAGGVGVGLLPQCYAGPPEHTGQPREAGADLGRQVGQPLARSVSGDERIEVGHAEAAGKGGSVAPPAHGNAGSLEAGLQGRGTDAGFAAEMQERFPADVAVDEVLEVRDFDWCGHVYDFQTEGGWLVSDSILTSNCRCVAIPLTIEDAAAKGVREARQWLATGVEPTPPARVPWPGFDLPKGWHEPTAIRAVVG